MGHDSTDQLVPLEISPELSRPRTSAVVRRAEVEEAFTLWEEALSRTARPKPRVVTPGEVFLLAEPLTAPFASTDEITPVERRFEDGFLARPLSEVEEDLREIVFQAIRRHLAIQIDALPETQPVVRTYFFSAPVGRVEGAIGEVYIVTDTGELRRFEPGMQSRHLVEIIAPSSLSVGQRRTDRMTCRVEGGVAYWS